MDSNLGMIDAREKFRSLYRLHFEGLEGIVQAGGLEVIFHPLTISEHQHYSMISSGMPDWTRSGIYEEVVSRCVVTHSLPHASLLEEEYLDYLMEEMGAEYYGTEIIESVDPLFLLPFGVLMSVGNAITYTSFASKSDPSSWNRWLSYSRAKVSSNVFFQIAAFTSAVTGVKLAEIEKMTFPDFCLYTALAEQIVTNSGQLQLPLTVAPQEIQQTKAGKPNARKGFIDWETDAAILSSAAGQTLGDLEDAKRVFGDQMAGKGMGRKPSTNQQQVEEDKQIKEMVAQDKKMRDMQRRAIMEKMRNR